MPPLQLSCGQTGVLDTRPASVQLHLGPQVVRSGSRCSLLHPSWHSVELLSLVIVCNGDLWTLHMQRASEVGASVEALRHQAVNCSMASGPSWFGAGQSQGH